MLFVEILVFAVDLSLLRVYDYGNCRKNRMVEIRKRYGRRIYEAKSAEGNISRK